MDKQPVQHVVTTLLTQNKYLAAKRFFPGANGKPQKQDFNAGKWFKVAREPVSDIYFLSKLLSGLEENPHALVIRGEPLPHVDLSKPVRRTKTGEEAYFQSAPNGIPWLCIDLDKIPLPEGLSLTVDPEAVIGHLVSRLPAYFHDVTCHWQFSASAGVISSQTVSAHLWFWLDHPVTDAEAKLWAKQTNAQDKLVDGALYNAVQPHYTAAPIFEGVPDPIPVRSGLLKGDKDSVEFPKVVIPAYAGTSYAGGLHESHSFEEWLNLIGDHDGGMGFHQPMMMAVWTYVQEHGQNTDREALKDRLRDAALNADRSKHSLDEVQNRASDEHIYGLIDTAIAKLTSQGKTGLIQGLEPYYSAQDLLTPGQAASELADLIEGFVEKPHHLAIKATAGIGKTEQIIRAHRKKWKGTSLVEIYVPTIALGEELAKRIGPKLLSNSKFLMKGPPIIPVVIRGRGQLDIWGKPMCRKADLAAQVSVRGISVYRHLCANQTTRCPYFQACPYLMQFRREADVRIFTHAFLGLERGFLDKDHPEFAVVDESFYAGLLKHEALPVDDLPSSGMPQQLSQALVMALLQKKPLLKALRDALGDDLLPTVDEALTQAQPAPIGLYPGMAESEQKAHLEAANHNPLVAKLLEVLTAELSTGREEAHGITYQDGQIQLHYRQAITRFANQKNGQMHHIPVLSIDADLDPTVHRVFFPESEYRAIRVERNCHVTQVYSTRNSVYSLVPGENATPPAKKRLAQVQKLIDRESAHSPTLVMGPQRITGNPAGGKEPLINVPETSALAHFGNIKGVDAYKDMETIIVISRNQPPIQGLEANARALWFDSSEHLQLGSDWLEEPRGYRTRSGDKMGVNVIVHPDGRIQRLHELVRESESQQAIDRLRLVHTKQKKRVILLSNLPLDITVDDLVSWSQLMGGGTKFTQAWKRLDGVMPLSSSWLADRFPDLFKTPDQAKWHVKQALQMGGKPNNNTISNSTHLAVFSYHLQGEAGKPRRCVSELDAPQTCAELEGLHGKAVVDLATTNQLVLLSEGTPKEGHPQPPPENSHDPHASSSQELSPAVELDPAGGPASASGEGGQDYIAGTS